MPRVLEGSYGSGRFIMGEVPYSTVASMQRDRVYRACKLGELQGVHRIASSDEGRVSGPLAMQRDRVQGYLAHKQTPTPLGPPSDPRHRPTVGS